jgi:dGTPase
VASAKAAAVTDVDSVRRYPERIVRFTQESGATSRELKRFLQKHVYHSPDLAEDRTRSMERLSRLFAHLMEHPELLPGGDTPQRADGEPLHRIVCDYIAGMTDGYFERVYTALLG